MVDNLGDEVKNLNVDPGERATKADFDAAMARANNTNFERNRPKEGLPVAGYKPTQPQAAIDAVNVFKHLEERTLRHIEALEGHGAAGVFSDADKRLLAIGRTQLQGAFMFLARAIFQPGRVKLPEDGHPELDEMDRTHGSAV